MKTTHVIPIFPLNAVLFPGGVLPLRIFEARYLDMIGECMRNQKGFGICAIQSGAEVGPAADCCHVGTLAGIQDFDRGEDGLLYVVAKGQRRFRIIDKQIEANQLLRAEVVWLEDVGETLLPSSRQPLAAFLEKLLNQLGEPFTELVADYHDAAWVAGRLTELLPFAIPDKQRLLEMDAPLDRLESIYSELLAEEVGS